MLIITSLFLIGISLRAYQLGRALGGGDENEILLSWVYTPIDSIVNTWSLGVLSGGHHVFHTITLRMMVLLFGEENELAIRFPAFAAGVACLWFIYKISREIFPSRALAHFAMLVSAVCPIHIYYSQTARGYSFMILFTSQSSLYIQVIRYVHIIIEINKLMALNLRVNIKRRYHQKYIDCNFYLSIFHSSI